MKVVESMNSFGTPVAEVFARSGLKSWEGRDFLIEKFQLPVGRVRVINNGIELPSPRDRMAARATLGLQSSDLMILMMANLTAFKDHENSCEPSPF